MTAETFTSAVMNDSRIKVLRFLLNNQDDDFTLSEIAEATDITNSTVSNIISELDDFGVVEKRKKGQAILVSINEHSPYIEVLEELGSIDARPLRNLAKDYAEELWNYKVKATSFSLKQVITSIILFGSVAAGIPTKDSDIDV
ncbi:MAG: helix-turn-helix domain-containing protein, partial [Candidatus Nanohaloarchaea archaeon]|nr:helix-turn-helix domain-containing protein [Candidatus Nanohaloarchaea archaeon]